MSQSTDSPSRYNEIAGTSLDRLKGILVRTNRHYTWLQLAFLFASIGSDG